MQPDLVETDESVIIDHIPRLEWGKNNDNSFIKAVQLALNTMGEDYSYDFLMGISGAAFRLHFKPDWCASSTDSTAGFDVSEVLFNTLGYDYELHTINHNNLDDIKTLYHKIVNQINMGIPVIGINLKFCPEWGLITGYQKNKGGAY